MALLFAWAVISQRSWRPLLRGVSGLALGLGLTCFYLMPAAYEQRWVNIGQALSSGLLPAAEFPVHSTSTDAEHTWFNWIASICALFLDTAFRVCGSGLPSLRLASSTGDPQSRKHGSRFCLLLGTRLLLTLRFTTAALDLSA